MHFPRRHATRLALVAIIGAIVWAVGCSKDPGQYWRIEAKCTPCSLHELAQKSVGPGAHDCATAGGTTAEIEACAIKMAAARRPFVAEERLQGIDSVIRAAYVGDDAGVRQLWFDSDRSGGLGKCRARVTQTTCSGLSASGSLCQEPRDRKVLCDEATSRVLETELGGNTRDLWCALDSDQPHAPRVFVCARNKLFLGSSLALLGGEVPSLTHKKGTLFCSSDRSGPGLLLCTQDSEWRPALGYRPSDRVEGPLAGGARASPKPAENR